ncbi:MAG: endonuclease V [Candidatus Hodarchaeota archaeon]
MQHLDLEQLKQLQIEKASLVKEKDCIKNPKILLAVSVFQKNQKIRAGGILYDLKSNSLLDSHLGGWITASSPYISTFLSVRNKQPLIQVITKFLSFDILMVEGAGRQHPRHFGLACELGVDLDLPTIGITKKALFGSVDFNHSLDNREYSYDVFPVYDKEDLIAFFIKKRTNKQGIYLSIGHKLSLLTAVDIVLPLLVYKFPEPLRLIKTLLRKST